MRRRDVLRGLALLGFGVLCGCLSPTLPLPPPDEPGVVTSLGDGTWEIEGDCMPGAIVAVVNDRTGEGAIEEDRDRDGRYSVVLPADPCDLAWITQSVGGEESARTKFVVQERTPTGPVDPNACR
jgi:hypothetical protein